MNDQVRERADSLRKVLSETRRDMAELRESLLYLESVVVRAETVFNEAVERLSQDTEGQEQDVVPGTETRFPTWCAYCGELQRWDTPQKERLVHVATGQVPCGEEEASR